MKKIYAVSFWMICSFFPLFAERIQIADFKESSLYCNVKIYEKEIVIGKGVKFTAKMEISARGNGILDFANLRLKIHDADPDIIFYENDLLDTDFIDIDGDGYKDIIISGIVCYVDDKNSDLVLKRESVVYIYMFSPAKKIFYLTYRDASFFIDMNREHEGPSWGGVEMWGEPERVNRGVSKGRQQAQKENEIMSQTPRSKRP